MKCITAVVRPCWKLPGGEGCARSPRLSGGHDFGAYGATEPGRIGRPERPPSGLRRSLPLAAPSSEPRHVSLRARSLSDGSGSPPRQGRSLCLADSQRANLNLSGAPACVIFALLGFWLHRWRCCVGDLRRAAASPRRRGCCYGTASCAPPWTGSRARRPSTAPGPRLKPGRPLLPSAAVVTPVACATCRVFAISSH